MNRLKYLDLRFYPNHDCSNVTEKSFAEFTFPELLGMRLAFYFENIRSSKDIIKNLCTPELEGLKCEFPMLKIEWLNLCRKKKNLRCLAILTENFIGWDYALLKHMFKCCPTLHFLCLWKKSSKHPCRLYYSNNVEQERICFDENFLKYRAFPRRIGSFLVNWFI